MTNKSEKKNIDLQTLADSFGTDILDVKKDCEKQFDNILQMKPKLVVNNEPIYELYDQDILFDYLAAKFHHKRGYPIGYLPRLRELEKEGKIQIIKYKRLNFGSLLHEGYNYIVWKPL